MRRLSELLTFPKPWYRKQLFCRLFFGERSVATTLDPQKQKRFGRRSSDSTVSPRPYLTRKNSSLSAVFKPKIPLGPNISGLASAIYVKPT